MTPHVCYGGTFDPVHNGHLAIARAVAVALEAPVYLLPSADPPHRPIPGASAEQRAQMLELAVADDPRLHVDRRELKRSGPSYSVDTLAQLRHELGPALPLVWVIGADSLLQLHTWKDWRQIFALAHVLAVERPGPDIDIAAIARLSPAVHAEILPRWQPASELSRAAAGACALLPLHPLRPESASEIRRCIGQKRPWQQWLTAPVAAYVAEKGLYRTLKPDASEQGV